MMGYLKRFAASVTAFVHKYRFDPFFSTEVNIVVLQLVFAMFLLAVLGIIASELYRDASAAVIAGIVTALQPHASAAAVGQSVVAQLDYTRSRTLIYSAAAIIAITVLFTYVITRLALAPTRHALESQKQFIGNVAHELRTPLAVSKTNIEVALLSNVIEKDLRGSLESTVEELDRISEIINNLLSLSASIRPERIQFRDVDLGDIVRSVKSKLHALAERKHLELEVRMSERTAVWGNTTALEQIVMNILKNSISHTPQSGRILMIIEPVHPDMMEFTVQDSGTGIARKDLFHIFEPYYRGDPSRRRAGAGSGLGLTIVSELVKLHNGRITVRSAEGRGTSVTVLLPAGKKSIAVAKKQGSEQDNESEITVDFSHNNRRVG